jgi:two-component system, OmpR family, response regulator
MARILVVDDTEIVRKALEVAMRRMGHVAMAAADGEEALALALQAPPDLALVDYRMPGMDGVELFARLRQELGERCPQVLFVTATPRAEVAERLGPVGRPAGFVKKPFRLDDLLQTVDRALEDGAAVRLLRGEALGASSGARRGKAPPLLAP